MPSSCSRPTSGVRCSPCSASKRPSARPSPSTRQADERLGKALEALRAEISQLEQPAHQPARRLADHHAARRRERLQPRREVRRLADHRLLLGRALADQLADHHQAGRDADPRRQRLAAGVAELPDCLDDRKPGAHRPLGLVLVRLRPAEIGQHAIAHVLGDMPVPALDHLGCSALVGADHRAHVLGIEPRRQLGRAHQIAEQHRQLPPLGLRSRRGLRRIRSACAFCRTVTCLIVGHHSDRLQQQAAMAEGNTQILEILICQLRQDGGRDVVVPERLLVALQPQLPQPSRDVHSVPLKAIKFSHVDAIRTTICMPPIWSRPSHFNGGFGSRPEPLRPAGKRELRARYHPSDFDH